MRLTTALALVAMAVYAAPVTAFDHGHSLLAQVLSLNVKEGRVRYAEIKAQPEALRRYLDQIANLAPAEFEKFSRPQQLALWINAYNAGVLASVIENYPLSRGSLVGLAFPANSIWQIPQVFKRKSLRVAGLAYSLDDIEHQIVRPRFREPRIHMALVCAARSCPPLRNEPYLAEILDAQLTDQTRSFLADRTHGLRIEPELQRIRVSAIFKWFAPDFAAGGDEARGLGEFVGKYVDAATRSEIARLPAVRWRYLSYDWTLNE
jgi:hypothetical protein